MDTFINFAPYTERCHERFDLGRKAQTIWQVFRIAFNSSHDVTRGYMITAELEAV